MADALIDLAVSLVLTPPSALYVDGGADATDIRLERHFSDPPRRCRAVIATGHRPDMGELLRVRFNGTYGDGVQVVKDALVEQGFSLLSQVDVSAAVGREVPTILGGYALLGVYVPELVEEAARHDADGLLGMMVHVAVHGGDGVVTAEAFEPAASPVLAGDDHPRKGFDLFVRRIRAAFDSLSSATDGADDRPG